MYPEHEKLKAMRERHEAVVDFYDFLDGLGVRLCQPHKHTDDCGHPRECGLLDGSLYEISMSPERLIGGFLMIDPVKLEAEKRAMLESLQNKRPE